MRAVGLQQTGAELLGGRWRQAQAGGLAIIEFRRAQDDAAQTERDLRPPVGEDLHLQVGAHPHLRGSSVRTGDRPTIEPGLPQHGPFGREGGGIDGGGVVGVGVVEQGEELVPAQGNGARVARQNGIEGVRRDPDLVQQQGRRVTGIASLCFMLFEVVGKS